MPVAVMDQIIMAGQSLSVGVFSFLQIVGVLLRRRAPLALSVRSFENF
jgi:hypothetical protein